MPATSDITQIPTAERDAFASAYNAGELQSVLAERYGLTAKGVRRLIIELGLPKRSLPRVGTPRRNVSVSVNAAVASDYDAGMSIDALREKYDLPLSRIYAALREQGKTLRRSSKGVADKVADDVRSTIVSMSREQRLTISQITEALGLPKHTVAMVVRHEIERPQRAILFGEEGNELRERVRQLYTGTDLTIAAIAGTMGVGISTITRLVRTLNVPKRAIPKGRLPKPPA